MKYPVYYWYSKGVENSELLLKYTSDRVCYVVRSNWPAYPVGYRVNGLSRKPNYMTPSYGVEFASMIPDQFHISTVIARILNVPTLPGTPVVGR